MPGMGRSAVVSANLPVLSVVLALFMLGYVLWTTDKLTSRTRVSAEMTAAKTPSRAALWTAEVVNVAIPEQRASRDAFPGLGAVFCDQLNKRMVAMFRAQYPGCGATVTRWLQ